MPFEGQISHVSTTNLQTARRLTDPDGHVSRNLPHARDRGCMLRLQDKLSLWKRMRAAFVILHLILESFLTHILHIPLVFHSLAIVVLGK